MKRVREREREGMREIRERKRLLTFSLLNIVNGNQQIITVSMRSPLKLCFEKRKEKQVSFLGLP